MKKKKDSFEVELGKLEEIRESLETRDMGLDEAIALYEEGMKRLGTCRERLKEYETTLEKLMVEDGETGDDEEN